MVTLVETPCRPALSVARAVSTYLPGFQQHSVILYGAFVPVPIKASFTKNSTFVIDPPAFVVPAVAVIVMSPPGGKVALFVGYVIATVGGPCIGFTLKITFDEPVTAPLLSVAFTIMG